MFKMRGEKNPTVKHEAASNAELPSQFKDAMTVPLFKPVAITTSFWLASVAQNVTKSEFWCARLSRPAAQRREKRERLAGTYTRTDKTEHILYMYIIMFKDWIKIFFF